MRSLPAQAACSSVPRPSASGAAWPVDSPPLHYTGGAGPSRVSRATMHAQRILLHGQRLHDLVAKAAVVRSSSWWPWGSTSGPSTNLAASTSAVEAASTTQTLSNGSSRSSPAYRSKESFDSPNSIHERPSLAAQLQQLLQISVPEPSHVKSLPAVTVRFTVPEFVTAPGQRLVLVGSVAALGSWDVAQGASMTWHQGHRWTADVQLDPGWHGALEYKVVLKDHNTYTWEPGSNRLLVVERPRANWRSSSTSPTATSSASPEQEARSPGKPRVGSPGHGSPGPALSVDEGSYSNTAAAGPVLKVECEWGKADPPMPPLPAALQCAAGVAGVRADGVPVGTLPLHEEAAGSAPVIMANCQVVVPLLEQSSLAAKLAEEEACGGSGLQLLLVGNLPALGCWAPRLALPLARDESGMWRARLELPMGYPVQAKLVLWDTRADKARMWEPGPNRTIRLPDARASMLCPPALGSAAQQGSTPSLNCSSSSSSGGMGSGTSSNASSDTSSAASSLGVGTPGSTGKAGRTAPFPVLPDGEFMLLMHWAVPTFPHRVFLPSVDHIADTASQQQQQQQGRGAGAGAVRAATAAGVPRQHPKNVLCRFTLPHFPTHPNQHLVLVGSCAQLGSWDPTRALRLQWGPGHSWQASAHLPADEEMEAKVVLWDGHQYRWEEGPNRRLRPGALVKQVAPHGCWGEVLHCLYWGTPALQGKTPAVVIPHDELLSSASLSSSSSSTSSRAHSPQVRTPGSPQPPSPKGSPTPGLNSLSHEPGMVLLGLSSLLTAAALALDSNSSDRAGLYGGEGVSGGLPGAGAAAAQQAASQVASLEASLDALRAQLAEANHARQREVDALRQQLTESSKALAVEEDQVESLHAQLATRGAELRSLTGQLARAEATAAAAVAAATTALSSASMQPGAFSAAASATFKKLKDQELIPSALLESMQQLHNNHNGNGNGHGSVEGGHTPGMSVVVATFQKLTEQLASVQLDADSARQALAEVQATKITEAAHLRSELSEAVASRHKEAEAARVAAAALAIAHQQEVSALQGALADVQAMRQREVAALQMRMEQMVSRQEKETARLARQLGQACAAAEALEAQLLAQRSATAALSASGSEELRRLRSLLSVQAQELEALRSQAADGHAAQVLLGRLSSNGNGQASSYSTNGSHSSNGSGYAASSDSSISSNGYAAASNGNGNGHATSSSDGHQVLVELAASNGSVKKTVSPLTGPLFSHSIEPMDVAGSNGSPALTLPASSLLSSAAVPIILPDMGAATLHPKLLNTEQSQPLESLQQAAVTPQPGEQSPCEPTGTVLIAGPRVPRGPRVMPASGPLELWLQQVMGSAPRNDHSVPQAAAAAAAVGLAAAAAVSAEAAGFGEAAMLQPCNNILPLASGSGGGAAGTAGEPGSSTGWLGSDSSSNNGCNNKQ